MKLKIHLPWRNLGCLGLTVNDHYGDAFIRPYLGVYINDGTFKRWYSWTGKLLKVEDIHQENARRVYGRTLKPLAIVTTKRGERAECVSFPYIDDLGSVRIQIRMVPGDCTTSRDYPCSNLRPIKFGWPWEKFAPAYTKI
jgi:hypothetical protein